MKYILYGLLAVVIASGCAKNNPVAPALDTGAANSGNITPPTNGTATHQTNVGNGNGKINFSAMYQNQPLKNTTIILTTLDGSTVNVTTDTQGKAYITGLNDGTYSAALQPVPGHAYPIQTKTTTISNGSMQSLSWQDAKLVSISPMDYNYSGYSPASGCTESTSPATYSDPRYYQFGNLAETRIFKLYYDDVGDFQGPASVSVSVDGNCTYTFTPSSTGDELGTLTYNIPAFNQNPTLNISITATCYGSSIFVKNYSLSKDWNLSVSGNNLVRSGRVNTDAVSASATVSAFSKVYDPVIRHIGGQPQIIHNVTAYSTYIVQSGSASWNGNSASIYSINNAVSPSILYLNRSPSAGTTFYTNDNPATPASETYSYSISVKYGGNVFATIPGSFSGDMTQSAVPGIPY